MQMIASLFLVAAQVLFNTGVQDVEAGRLERARLTLQTLINTYPYDPLVPDAKAQIEAIKLYEEGQDRLRQGRFEAAEFTFQTLVSVYPESSLVTPAEAAMHKAAQAQEELNVRLTVRAVDLKDAGLDAGEIRKLFADREVRLAAGKVFDPRDVEQARLALTEFLGSPVRTEVRTAGEHQVDVVLTRLK